MATSFHVKQASDWPVKQETEDGCEVPSDSVSSQPDVCASGPAAYPVAASIAAPDDHHAHNSLHMLATAGHVPCCSDPDAPVEPEADPQHALQQAVHQPAQDTAHQHGQQAVHQPAQQAVHQYGQQAVHPPAQEAAHHFGQQAVHQPLQEAVQCGIDNDWLHLSAITRLGVFTQQELQERNIKVLEIPLPQVPQLGLLAAISTVKAFCPQEHGKGLGMDLSRYLPDQAAHLCPQQLPSLVTPSYSEEAHCCFKHHSHHFVSELLLDYLRHISQHDVAQQANIRPTCSAATGQCAICSVASPLWQFLIAKGKCAHREAAKLQQAGEQQYQLPWASHASSLLGSTYVFRTNITCLRNPLDINDHKPDYDQLLSLLATDHLLRLLFPDSKEVRLSEKQQHMVSAFQRADPSGPWKVLTRYAGFAHVQTRSMTAKAAAGTTTYQNSVCGSNTATPTSSSSGHRGCTPTCSTAVGKGVSASRLKGVRKGPAVKGGDSSAMKNSRRMLAALFESVELYLPEAVFSMSHPQANVRGNHRPASGPLPTPKKRRRSAPPKKKKGRKGRGKGARKQLFQTGGGVESPQHPPGSPTASTAGHHG